MTRTFSLLAAAALLCAAQAAFAEPAAPPAPAVATKAFQDWLVRCPVAAQPLPCDAVQLLVEPKSKQRILSVSVAHDAQSAKNVIRIVLPLGVWLPNGITVVAGATKLEKVAIRRCEPFGCVVEGLLDPKLQDAMRKGGDAKIVVFDQANKPLDLKFSLLGFGDAQDYAIAETKKVKPVAAPAKPN